MQIRTPDGRYQARSANPYLPWGSTAPPSNGDLGLATAGVIVSEQSAMQHAAVYGSVSFIADAIATLPIRQYRMVSGDPVQMEPAQVIAQPWAEFDQRDFITQGSLSMLLRGNLWGKRIGVDDRGCPEQIQLIHPDHARIRRNPQDGRLEVRYRGELVPWEQVTRKMAISGPEALQGVSPIENLRNAFGLARAQDLYAGAFFANSARPDGVIEVQDDLDPNETEAMAAAWDEAHGGISRSHKPAVLTGGATWKPVTMSMADSQFLEMMQWSASVISGMIYRLPPHALGMTDKETSWGAGIEQMEIGMVRNTLLIWLCRWEDLMRSWLPPRQFVTFDLKERLRGDTLQRWSAYQIARVVGAMNNEEVRAEEGLPRVANPAQATVLADYAAPLNSAPVKPTSTGGAGGDKAD